jgi:hypothetical protein
VSLKEELTEPMEYPEQEKMHRVLKYLHDELSQSGRLRLKNQFQTKKRLVSRSVKEEEGYYNANTGENVTEKLGLTQLELAYTLDRLRDGGRASRNAGPRSR